ncbi:MAG: hypothetical protein EPN26_00280 [Rhodospirillales bacterium]|nr:MAG: hypothetical protein EPN26_00280 [Rhodospirillales bacterium]
MRNLLVIIGASIFLASTLFSGAIAKDAQPSAARTGKKAFSFMDHTQGETTEEFKQRLRKNFDEGRILDGNKKIGMPSDCCSELSDVGKSNYYLRIGDVGGVPVSIMYDFSDGRLTSIFVSVHRNFYGKFRTVVMNTYGKPTIHRTQSYQNGFGATFNGVSDAWMFSNGILSYDEICGKPTEACLYFAPSSDEDNQGKVVRKTL